MGSELIAREAEGRMGYWLQGHKGEMNNCFTKIQLLGQKNNETKLLSRVKARKKAIQPPLIWFSKPALFACSGYNIKPSSSSTNQDAALIIGGHDYRV